MINKQTATLSFQLLSVMDKLFTLAAPASLSQFEENSLHK